MTYEVMNLGIAGFNASAIVHRLENVAMSYDPDLIIYPAAVAVVDGALGRLQAIAEKRGICVLVVQHTPLFFLHAFHPFRRHHAVVAKLVAAHGFTNKDTLEYFVGREGLDVWVGPFDPHPNAEGHAILARAARDGLRELPARCWAAPGPPPSLAAASHASIAR